MSSINTLATRIKSRIKHLSTAHVQGPEKNIFIFSTARSGTTWLAELLATQGRFKLVNEPCNLRQPVVRERLGIDSWEGLFQAENRPKMQAYLQAFIDDTDRDWRFKRETPFSEFWHWRTDRIIFKILFAGEDAISWFRDQFNGRIILLLRHPIPVSLSRKELPRLPSFLTPPYSNYFTARQLDAANAIVSHGTAFEKAILDWSLQNSVRLRTRELDWLLISYEQLALQPELVIEHLTRTLSLPDPKRMHARLFKASNSTGKSNTDAQRVLRDTEALRNNRRWLVEKWQKKVTPEQVSRAFEILRLFDIDFYEPGSFIPARRYLIGDDIRPAP